MRRQFGIRSPSRQTRLLSWLRAHGFRENPFPREAFLAETDPIWKWPNLEGFVDPPDYDEDICGTPESPGLRFIVGAAGTGKSSLRRRIKRDFDDRLQENLPGIPKVLAIEYVHHDYDKTMCHAEAHVERIAEQVRTELTARQANGAIGLVPGSSARAMLEKLVQDLNTSGYHGLCVLVDNFNSAGNERPEDAFRRIEPLASNRDLLAVENVLLKFMIPEETPQNALNSLPTDAFPLHHITWDRRKLHELLQQRALAYIDGIRDAVLQQEPLADLCSEEISSTISATIVDYGMDKGHPRAMWHLGHFLLKVHSERLEADNRVSKLITHDCLLGAFDLMIKGTTSTAPEARVTAALRDEIKKYAAQDQLEDAVKLLRQVDEDKAINLSGRLGRTNVALQKGIIDRSQYNSERNTVLEALLETC